MSFILLSLGVLCVHQRLSILMMGIGVFSNNLQCLQTRQLLNRKLMGLGGQFCQMLLHRVAMADGGL
jgi:hypothetical protein